MYVVCGQPVPKRGGCGEETATYAHFPVQGCSRIGTTGKPGISFQCTSLHKEENTAVNRRKFSYQNPRTLKSRIIS